MADNTWVQQQKTHTLLQGAGAGKQAKEMLRRTDTNRIVTVRQAQLELVGLEVADVLNAAAPGCWDWMKDWFHRLEDLQLTVGNPKNARDAYVEFARVEAAVAERDKAMFSR